MGNDPGRLTSKHLDKNHIFEPPNPGFRPNPSPSITNYSITTSQKSSVSHLPKPVLIIFPLFFLIFFVVFDVLGFFKFLLTFFHFFFQKQDLSRFFELSNTLTFVQNYLDNSFSYKSNICLAQNNVLICNEEDLETPPNFFNRETFGGGKGRKPWDKKTVMRSELQYLMDVKSEKKEKTFISKEKNLFIDLNLSNISHTVKNPFPYREIKEKEKEIKEEKKQEEVAIYRKESEDRKSNEDRKSPQFQTKCSFLRNLNIENEKINIIATEDFQTANFTGIQSYLLNKAKDKEIPQQKIQKPRDHNQNTMKSSSENRIMTPNPRKNSKTESEFSDFSNHSYSELPLTQKDAKTKAKNLQNKSPTRSPIKSAQLVKGNDRDVFNFKKDKEKPMTFSNKSIEENIKTGVDKKKSMTPSMKPPKVEENKKNKGPTTNPAPHHQNANQNTSYSKIAKNSQQNMKESTPGNSSEEEPLHIKISLDLKKFNKNLKGNNNNNINNNNYNSNNNNKIEENGEEKEFENNQFLKSVVKDIDKLTQKMLNTNNNLSGLNTSQGFKLSS